MEEEEENRKNNNGACIYCMLVASIVIANPKKKKKKKRRYSTNKQTNRREGTYVRGDSKAKKRQRTEIEERKHSMRYRKRTGLFVFRLITMC